ncbi:hypothetical protein QOT17_016869 [Balamuthia mandrillaris]
MKQTDLPTKDQQIQFYHSLWLECCTAWVETHPDEFDKDVLAEAVATYEVKNKSPLCWPNIHRQLCHQHISGILQSFFSDLNELVDEFIAPILPKLVNRLPIHKAFLTSHQEQPFLPTFPNDFLKNNYDDNDRNHNSKEKTPPQQRKNGHLAKTLLEHFGPANGIQECDGELSTVLPLLAQAETTLGRVAVMLLQHEQLYEEDMQPIEYTLHYLSDRKHIDDVFDIVKSAACTARCQQLDEFKSMKSLKYQARSRPNLTYLLYLVPGALALEFLGLKSAPSCNQGSSIHSLAVHPYFASIAS